MKKSIQLRQFIAKLKEKAERKDAYEKYQSSLPSRK